MCARGKFFVSFIRMSKAYSKTWFTSACKLSWAGFFKFFFSLPHHCCAPTVKGGVEERERVKEENFSQLSFSSEALLRRVLFPVAHSLVSRQDHFVRLVGLFDVAPSLR